MIEKRSLNSLQNLTFFTLMTIGWLSTPAIGQLERPATTPETADSLPYRQQPVDYFGSETTDRLRQITDQFAQTGESLTTNGNAGYLKSLLKALDIPVESQLLVFSKTALNPQLVSPFNPRAIYFNDDTYVGWVPGSGTIEVCSLDPKKGAIFYMVQQPAAADDSPPNSPCMTFSPLNSGANTLASEPDGLADNIRRESRCLTCHVSSRTEQVPGVLVGSFLTDESGKPVSGYSNVELSTAWEKRFGGWYVTGGGKTPHLGNRVRRDRENVSLLNGTPDGSLGLLIDGDRYPVVTSDLIAHLIFQHQVRVHNLLIRVIQETAFDRPGDSLDRLCRELLFEDEAQLPQRMGRSEFSRQFERTDEKHPLRQFDLQDRLFKSRVSFLLVTDLFDRIDNDVRARVLHGLWERLHKPRLSDADRVAVIALVRQHVKRLPDVWMTDDRQR